MTLRNKNELLVNHKRVYRLMKKHKLGVMRSALKACRTPQKSTHQKQSPFADGGK